MSRPVAVGIALMVATALVNLAVFAGAPGGIKPIRLHDSNDLDHLVRVEQRSLAAQYELYLALRRHAAGLRLVAPDGVMSRTHLDGLSDMELALAAATTPLNPEQAEELRGRAAVTGEIRIPGEDTARIFHLVEPAEGASEMILTFADDEVLVADAATLEATASAR